MSTIHSFGTSTYKYDSGKVRGELVLSSPLSIYFFSEVAAFAAAQIMPTKAILFTTSATL